MSHKDYRWTNLITPLDATTPFGDMTSYIFPSDTTPSMEGHVTSLFLLPYQLGYGWKSYIPLPFEAQITTLLNSNNEGVHSAPYIPTSSLLYKIKY